MTATATKTTTPPANVGMGQIALVARGETAKTVLGSCIGLAIYHPRGAVAVVAHVVLAASDGRTGMPGKFVDTAIPEMLRLLASEGVTSAGLHAKLAGGANMFGSSGPLQVGEANYQAVVRLLRERNIRIAGEDIGGGKGRRITFDATNKQMVVEVAGQPPLVL